MNGSAPQPGNAPASFAFPRNARVLKPAEYQQVLRRGRRIARGQWFQVMFARGADATPSISSGQARLGLIVGKRNAPLAVSRNAIKRVWREAFRQIRTILPPGDYVVRLHLRIPDVSRSKLKALVAAEARRLFEQAARPSSRPPAASPAS